MSNLCPLCQAPNNCKLLESEAAAKDCWCMQVKIPAGVLAEIPPEKINTACICKVCALQTTSK